MSFNLKQALQESMADQSAALEAIILGPGDAGKSTLIGTLGVKTLFLYTTRERHGSKSAKIYGGDNLLPVCINRKDGKDLNADESITYLMQILTDTETLKSAGIEAIAIDGLTELDFLVRDTAKWKNLCLTDKGKHNNFAEGTATLQCLRPIIVALQELHRTLNMHYMITCVTDVKEKGIYGEILDATPKVQGYFVAESVIQMFNDRLLVGPMTRDDVTKYKLQFGAKVTKVSKDDKGGIKKINNFTPCIKGVSADELPAYMDADLAKFYEFKKEKLS